MKIIKHKTEELYTCNIDNRLFTSPNYSEVMVWRDHHHDKIEYYRDCKILHDKAMQYMYNNNPTNYTGD